MYKIQSLLDVSRWVVQLIFRRYFIVSQLYLSFGFHINNEIQPNFEPCRPLETLLRCHCFSIFYLINDRIPRPARFSSIISIDIERVFFNFNCFSHSSSCVMINVGNDSGVFHENVVFGGYGVF